MLDLGAAPGSWSLYAAKQIGDAGRVLAIDLSPEFARSATMQRSHKATRYPSRAKPSRHFAPYDVVLSDMAPSTTGSKTADQARSFELFSRALAIAATLGAPAGSFVGKLFMSHDFVAARDAVRALFEDVRTIRPEGTRSLEL